VAKPVTQAQLRKFSISTGAVLESDFLLAVFSNDALVKRDSEDQHCYFGFQRGGQWKLVEFAWPIRSQALITEPARCVISVSSAGNVRRTTPSGGTDEPRVGEASGKTVYGRTGLFEVREINGLAYAVGTRRAAYRRRAEGVWDCIDADCYDADNFDVGFQSIHGFSKSEIYAVGRGGEIWEYDGRHWTLRDSGTNVTLHKVLCAEDGFVYAVGKKGTIVKGRHDRWQILPDIRRGYEFWSIQDHGGRMFLTASARVLLELSKAGTLEPVNFGECDPPTTAYHLTLGDGGLYSYGAKDIRRFDGQEWHEVLTLD
jgi:hypothetical protein